MALIDTDLVVRYYCDEQADGESEAGSLEDDGPGDAFDLVIDYGTADAQYTVVGANTAWETLDHTGGPVANKAINGPIDAGADDKIGDLAGQGQITIELVVNLEAGFSSVGRAFGITGSGDEGALIIAHDAVDEDGGHVRFNGAGNMTFDWEQGVRAVWHFVFDSSLGSANDRIKIYKNGSFWSDVSYVHALDEDESLAIEAESFLCVGNRANDGNRGVNAKFFYAAIYAGAFSAQDCSDNYDVLTADDDTPGAPAGVAPTSVIYGPLSGPLGGPI